MLKIKLVCLLQTGTWFCVISPGHHSMIYPTQNPGTCPPFCTFVLCPPLSQSPQWGLVTVILISRRMAFPRYRLSTSLAPLSLSYLQGKHHPPEHSLPTCKAFALSLGTFQPFEAFAHLHPSSLPRRPCCVCRASWFTCLPICLHKHICPSWYRLWGLFP